MTDERERNDFERTVQRLADLQAINQLFIDYGAHLDAGDLDAYAECFTHDARLLIGPLGRATGRDEIKEVMRAATGRAGGNSFHLITSPRIDLDGDTATTVVMWTVIVRGSDGRPELGMLGRHEDIVVRDTDGRWRFRQRKGFVDIPSAMPRADPDH
jgi:uncharacterized protein (TIGR02246 family)